MSILILSVRSFDSNQNMHDMYDTKSSTVTDSNLFITALQATREDQDKARKRYVFNFVLFFVVKTS